MKKILSTVLAAVMILSALASLAIIPASAASTTDGGDWIVYANRNAYLTDGDGQPDLTSNPDATVAGYKYTDEGFHTYAEFKTANGEKQKIVISSKTEVNLKEGITMSVRVDEYAYGDDMWFSYGLWDTPLPAHGDASNGNGICTLIRPKAINTGSSRKPVWVLNETEWTGVQCCLSDASFYDKTGTLGDAFGTPTNPVGWLMFNPGNIAGNSINDADKLPEVVDGKPTLTMDLTYDADTDQYNMVVCGVTLNQNVVNIYLHDRFPDGMAYVNFTLHGTRSDCTAACTITEYNDEKPTGTDDVPPYVPEIEPIAPIIDSDTIEDDQPALLFDANNTSGDYDRTGRFSSTSALKYTTNADNTFTLLPQTIAAAWFGLSPKNSSSYEASDFPYFTVLLRDFCNCVFEPGETLEDCAGFEYLSMYYCAGEIIGSSDNYFVQAQSTAMDEWGDDGHNYKLYIFDLSGEDSGFEGRINFMQVVFNNIILTNEGQNNMDLCYAGFFKTNDAADNYAKAYIENATACAHEHKETLPAVPATCDTPGMTEGEHCLDCGKWFKQQEATPMTGHKLVVAAGTSATCTEAGLTDGEACENAGCTYTTQRVIEALGHSYTYVVVDEDTHKQVCARCQDETETVAHELNEQSVCVCGYGCDHEETEWTVETPATCIADGIERNICKHCHATVGGADGVRAIEKLGHDEEIIPAVAATCTVAGSTEGKVCKRCNTTIVSTTVVPVIPHTSEKVEGTSATCIATGLTDGEKCSVCGYEITAQTTIEATGHTYENGKCTVCGADEPKPDDNNNSNIGTSTSDDDKTDNDGGKKGCGSVVGLGALAISATVALAGVMCFKKKED